MNEQLGQRHLYQSPGMKDVAMDIRLMHPIDEGTVLLSIEWWNVGPHYPFNMGISQQFSMPLAWIKELEEYIYQNELFTVEGI